MIINCAATRPKGQLISDSIFHVLNFPSFATHAALCPINIVMNFWQARSSLLLDDSRVYNVFNNVLFTLNRTTHSSVVLLCVVRFNVNKTLHQTAHVITIKL